MPLVCNSTGCKISYSTLSCFEQTLELCINSNIVQQHLASGVCHYYDMPSSIFCNGTVCPTTLLWPHSYLLSLCVDTPITYSYRMYYTKTHLLLSFWCIAEKQPFEAWVTEAVSEVAGLLHEASDGKSYRDAKEKLDGIQEVAEAKEKEVSTLSDLSTQFLIAGKVS